MIGRGVGPTDARIMIVGEAWGKDEAAQGEPFVGLSGMELSKLLAEAGISRSECFITNVINARPPDNDLDLWWCDKKKKSAERGLTHLQNGYYYNDLIAEGLRTLEANITAIRPRIVICLGNAALWALTGNTGITSWRGSVLWSERYSVKVCPTLHPAYILRVWEERHLITHDLGRFVPEVEFPELRRPEYEFIIRPGYEEVITRLLNLTTLCDAGPTRLAVDIETAAGHITCIGIGWSRLEAMCIPLMIPENPMGYWPLEHEQSIILALRRLLLHPNARIVGQNFTYDAQYTAKWWGFAPKMHMDTMLVHHICYLGMAKGLGFLSSLYCSFHSYWKGKEERGEYGTAENWTYNCTDCVVTYEVSEELEKQMDTLNQRWQCEFTMSLFAPVLRMMLRGVRFDEALGTRMAMEVLNLVAAREQLVINLTGKLLNANSPKQLIDYFYFVLQLPKQFHPVRKNLTTDSDALEKLAKIEPLVSRLCYALIEIRSLYNSLSVITKKRDSDGRTRCSYNIAGTETTRFSSSENAFDNGGNLQNITSGGTSKQTGLVLPNLRRLFVPDVGKVIVDVDLDRADAQVVAWEADDPVLKQIFREGHDLHLMNAKSIWGDYVHAKSPERQLAKIFCHAANYGAQPRTLSRHLGITQHQAEQIHKKWFSAHPEITAWHKRINLQLQTTRQVKNAFGFRRLYMGRIDQAFTEALAWIPQSTVAVVINHGLRALDTHMPEVELLLQVHDSLDFQIPRLNHQLTLERVRPHLLITVPYPDPLIIPIGFKTSEISWGDAK